MVACAKILAAVAVGVGDAFVASGMETGVKVGYERLDAVLVNLR